MNIESYHKKRNNYESVIAICPRIRKPRAVKSFRLDLPNFYMADGYSNDQVGVATSTRFIASAHKSIHLKAGSNENRSALLLSMSHSGIIIVNVHFTSRNEARSSSELAHVYSYLIHNYLDKSCLIIGDFNHDPRQTYRNQQLSLVHGPRHEYGKYLDWAMGYNVGNLTSEAYPDYKGSDHAPWYITIT